MAYQRSKTWITPTTTSFVFLLSLFPVAIAFPSPQGRHERHMKQVEESAKPTGVNPMVSFQDNASYDKTFDDVVTFLKKQGYTIDSASKDAGTIFTTMSIKGHWRQTGTRINVSLIRDSKTVTEVKVAVTEQKRYKALQTEPWGSPKVDKKQSSAVAAKMKAALLQSRS